MLKLTSLPSATVVKMAPDGAAAAAGDTAIQSGSAAPAAIASHRMCVLRITLLPKSVVPGAVMRLDVSHVDQWHDRRTHRSPAHEIRADPARVLALSLPRND